MKDFIEDIKLLYTILFILESAEGEGWVNHEEFLDQISERGMLNREPSAMLKVAQEAGLARYNDMKPGGIAKARITEEGRKLLAFFRTPAKREKNAISLRKVAEWVLDWKKNVKNFVLDKVFGKGEGDGV